MIRINVRGRSVAQPSVAIFSREVSMSTGQIAYLALAIGSAVIFMAVLAFCAATTRKKP